MRPRARLPGQLWKVLVCALGFSAIVSLVVPPLGLNLFTEAVGIVFAVAIIERFLRDAEADRTKPARLAALRMAARIQRQGAEMIDSAVGKTARADELALGATLEARPLAEWAAPILGRLDMSARSPSVVPAEEPGYAHFLPWRSHLAFEVGSMRVAVASYLSRHTVYGDPTITRAIQDIEINGLFKVVETGTIDQIHTDSRFMEPMWSDFLSKFEALWRAVEAAISTDGLGGQDDLDLYLHTPSLRRSTDHGRSAL